MAKPKFRGNFADLFYELVRTDFVLRYHNSLPGFIWVMLKPFLIFAVLVTVFSLAFKIDDRLYPLNLLLGLLLYSYFSEATLRGLVSLNEKASIIVKVNFPKVIAILTSVVNSFISFFFGFLAFLGFWFWLKPQGSLWGLVYFFLLVLILTVIIIGVNFFLSVVFVNLKDLQSIWEVLLQTAIYLSPIIYPLKFIPEKFREFYLFNPLSVVISEAQAVLIAGVRPDWRLAGQALITAGLILLLGWLFFSRRIKKISENF